MELYRSLQFWIEIIIFVMENNQERQRNMQENSRIGPTTMMKELIQEHHICTSLVKFLKK